MSPLNELENKEKGKIAARAATGKRRAKTLVPAKAAGPLT
jgi:hypothetical protein